MPQKGGVLGNQCAVAVKGLTVCMNQLDVVR